MKQMNDIVHSTVPDLLPVVPTMDIVVFPNQIVPLLVLDERIIKGIQKAVEDGHKLVLLLASKKQSDTHHGIIGTKDLYDVGTVASIMRVIKACPEAEIVSAISLIFFICASSSVFEISSS